MLGNNSGTKGLQFDPKMYRQRNSRGRRSLHAVARFRRKYGGQTYLTRSVALKGSTVYYDDNGILRIKKWTKEVVYPDSTAKKKLHKLTGGNHTKHLMSKAAF